MFVVIVHMRYAGAFSASSAYIAPSMDDAKYLGEKLLHQCYEQYCEDEGKEQEFEIKPLSTNDSETLMMSSCMAFTYKGGYGEVITITEA